MKKNNVLFIVCARNGSKGVINKNIRKVRSKELILHTLDFLKKCDFKTHLMVSTDGNPIHDVVKNSVDWVHERPAELASDEIGRWPVLLDAVKATEKHYNITYDYVFDFLATAPLRRKLDLTICYEKIQNSGINNVITAVPSHRNPYFNMIKLNEDNAPEIVSREGGPYFRRQDAPETFDMNGSIYAWTRKSLFSSSDLFTQNTALHIMPRFTSVDIDNEEDFEYLDFLLEKNDYLG